jgi:hypothetical protein
MIVFFVSKRLAFGSKVRLNRHVDRIRELGVTHVIEVRLYPSKKLRKFKTIHVNLRTTRAPAQCGFMLALFVFIERLWRSQTLRST